MPESEMRQVDETAPVRPAAALTPTDEELAGMRAAADALPEGDPVRRLAECVLAGQGPEAELVDEVLAAVGSYDLARWREQELACRALGLSALAERQKEAASESIVAFTKASRYAAFALLEDKGRLSTMVGGRITAIARALCVGLVLGALVLIQARLGADPAPLLLIAFLGALGVAELRDRRIRATRSAAMVALGRIGYKSTVPYLARLCFSRDVRALPWASPWLATAPGALAALLPLLQPSDIEWLPPKTLRLLARGLRVGDEGLVLAILDAFTKVGDASVLRAVEGASARATSGPVHEAAERALAAIRARTAAANDQALLLRPASAPTDTLLRPASPPQGDADLLLRPAEKEE